MSELKIVDFVCDSNDRSSETIKVIKILNNLLVAIFRKFELSLMFACIIEINNKFCYYCFFYLLFFKERRIFCVNKKTEKHHKDFEVDFDNCIDTETFELFFFN